MMTAPANRMAWIGYVARLLSCGLLIYWLLFALLAPVSVWDAHVYNLGRLPLTELGGLFGNPLWTSERQLIFPWGFDAIHLPLLHLGYCFSLPSFMCLAGTLEVARRFLTDRHGSEAGWIGVLALLGLPVLVFQSVITKNDIPILFGVAVWFHAMRSWQKDGRFRHLFFAAIAIGFTVGSKTSGVIPAGLCMLISAWTLRRSTQRLLAFGAAAFAAVALLGSVETYFASYQRYQYPIGPKAFAQAHRNNDGLRGSLANALRYAFANTSSGLEIWQTPDRITPRLEILCRKTLSQFSLTNRGNKADRDDHTLSFIKQGWDANSDYGPLGTICLGMLLLTLLWWRPQDDWWRFGVFAGLNFAGVCHSVAWMPWNNRFLLLPFALLAVALVSLLYARCRRQRWAVVLLFVVSVYAAVAYPLASFNKRPSDLLAAITQRDQQMFKERASMYPVLSAVRAWADAHPSGTLHLLAGSDSWVLPFFYLPNLHVDIVSTPRVTRAIFEAAKLGRTEALLVLNRSDFHDLGQPLRELHRFADEPGTVLFEVLPSGSVATPAISRESGFYNDGWTADKFVISVKNWPDNHIRLELGNPTFLIRSIVLHTSSGERRMALGPNEVAMVSLLLEGDGRIEAIVTPAFVPRDINGSPDERKLGVRVSFTSPASETDKPQKP
jgi:hypothetical protein